MYSISALSLLAAITFSAPASAATFFEFAFDWSSNGTDYQLSGTTEPGQDRLDRVYDVTQGLSFSIDGVDSGFQIYDGILRNFGNNDWDTTPDTAGVIFSEAGDGTITATLDNRFVWFSGAGWDFTSANQRGKRGYVIQRQFVIFTDGREVRNQREEQANQFVPSFQPNFSTRDQDISRQGFVGAASQVAVVPLPPALPMLAAGLLGLALLRRRVGH